MNAYSHWSTRTPWLLIAAAIGLMLIGLTGIERSDLLIGSDHLSRQMFWIVLAIPTMMIATKYPYREMRHISLPLFLLSLGFLVLVFFMPAQNGSHRWIPMGVLNVQPSEFSKLTYIMALAHYLMYRSNYRRLTGLIVPFVLTLVPVGLILKEPDLGTSLVFLPILFAMLFAAGARVRHLVLIVFLGVCTLPAFWMGMSAEQKSRVVTLFLQEDGGDLPTGDGYHLHQSKQVIALGGLSGSELSGMPIDDPLAYHLPAGRTDFIFSLISERWGLIGSLLTLAFYFILFWQGLKISKSTREPYGRLLCVGIVSMLAAQSIINTGMTVGLMPITGLTLPLVSYGGSSLLSTSLAVGLMINVALHPGYEIGSEPFRFAADPA
ncbi:rod shape-determining protein RodA [bacterium]|jgi:rod shape determining protein RodA|nr:rod shape-determining protein RodA [bacterium]MDB4787003.1 rod shape-determining protein RodA [Planctomycetaceae bacterium]